MKTLLSVILGAVLVNNYALEKFLGITPLMGFSGKDGKILRMGLAVTLVMVVSSAICWPVQVLVLDKLGLGYMQLLVFVAVILAVVYAVNGFVKLGVYFPVIAVNGAVLGAAVSNVSAGYSFVEAVLSALGGGLGFLLAMWLFSGVCSRIDEKHVPKAFRGIPVSLLAASVISMVLVAFK